MGPRRCCSGNHCRLERSPCYLCDNSRTARSPSCGRRYQIHRGTSLCWYSTTDSSQCLCCCRKAGGSDQPFLRSVCLGSCERLFVTNGAKNQPGGNGGRCVPARSLLRNNRAGTTATKTDRKTVARNGTNDGTARHGTARHSRAQHGTARPDQGRRQGEQSKRDDREPRVCLQTVPPFDSLCLSVCARCQSLAVCVCVCARACVYVCAWPA